MKISKSMLSKLGFLLLLACVGLVLLFLTFVERDLRSQTSKTMNLIHSHMMAPYEESSSGDVRILIEPPLCNATFLIWIVTSYAGDRSTRSALRRAYMAEELQALGIERVFLLGKLNDEAKRKTHVSQEALLDESRRFRDILQGDFLDTYRNLTYKHLMGLRWATNNCKHIKYIMKMDDDIVVNVYGILELLQSNLIETDSLTGYIMRNLVPIREPANKWYVSKREYANNIYPNFISGWLYITNSRVTHRLINHVDQLSSNRFFWIDDVFVTGILRKAVDIRIQDISEIYTTDYRYLECCMKGKTSLLKCEFLVGPNGGDVELQVRFKEFAKFCHANCSVRAENNRVGKTCVSAYKEPLFLHKGSFQINPVKIL